jgi:opacity protein-like surface antigen
MRKILIVMIIAAAMTAGMAQAQTAIGFNGIGGHVGFAMPEDPIKSTLAFGARADLGTFMKENIKLAGDLLFWSSGEDEAYYEWSWSQFYVSVLALYFLGDANASMKPYAGGGLGMVFASWESKYSGPDYGYDFGSYSHSDSELCIHLLAGIQKSLGNNLTGFAEVAYILGGFDTLLIHAGAVFNLSK